jgi:glucose-6-phosphate isomerase
MASFADVQQRVAMTSLGTLDNEVKMSMDRLTIDLARCMTDGKIERGLTQAMMDGLRPRLDSGLAAVQAAAGTGMLEWTDLPYRDFDEILQYAAMNHGKYDSLVVIGIGGSALGTIALATALLPFYWNELTPSRRRHAPRLYVLDNVDPDETAALLDHLDMERTLVNVSSKSGTTGESMATYLVVRQRLESIVGARAVKEHLVFTTDPSGGALRQIGEASGVSMFDLPAGVGGRFSVLSPVGLVPAALLGLDVSGLLAGARDMAEWIQQSTGWENPACAFAGVQYLNDVELGRNISVMMPYSARLRDVTDWYRQLWAESLGKRVDRKGRIVNVGPTPVKGLGVTDQHSQLQLYAEGPDDKIISFLGVSEFAQPVDIPSPGPGEEALAYLGGHTLAELLSDEQKSTAWALSQQGRPSLTITLPRVDAKSVGAFIYMLEMATAVAGELYDIDAFDQPGVELSKRATYALMGREGYSSLAREIG